MIWNRQLRYTPYKDWSAETLIDLQNQVQSSKWKMNHHIHPKSGLLNDPNGFSYFNKQWHLFYQTYPFGPVHGLKSWQHLTSDNLIDWQDQGIAIEPDSKYDSHGAYTGTALPVDDKLFIMYTGNVRTDDWDRQSYQNGAWLDADNKVTKMDQPLIINAPQGYTTSIRDPYLIEKKGKYYALIGAQTESEQGALLAYESTDLKTWKFLEALAIPKSISGYMIECPNLIFIDDKPIFIFCPQGLDQQQLSYQNIYPNVYATAEQVDLETGEITDLQQITQLDDGFDVYATEAIDAPDGRALAVSWVGLPEIVYPTDVENWAHCLSLVKELTLKDDHLYQNPAKETEQLRINSQQLQVKNDFDSQGSFEMELTIPADSQLDFVVTDAQNDGQLQFKLDSNKGIVTIDRSQTGHPFAEKFGQSRTSQVEAHKPLKIRLIIDVSVFECYIDNGYSVMTGRFFLSDLPKTVQITSDSSEFTGTTWEWRK